MPKQSIHFFKCHFCYLIMYGRFSWIGTNKTVCGSSCRPSNIHFQHLNPSTTIKATLPLNIICILIMQTKWQFFNSTNRPRCRIAHVSLMRNVENSSAWHRDLFKFEYDWRVLICYIQTLHRLVNGWVVGWQWWISSI